MKIAVACDHAGFEYKERLVAYLKEKGHEVKDFGTDSLASMDYPDTVHPMAFAIETGNYERGFVLCGSGNGVAITANKHQGIRCALCWQVDIAQLARQHNDANVCSIPARFIAYQEAERIAEAFVSTEFEGGRHANRVAKIPATTCKI
ncbi:ribose 5-phosphate isomerase B [Porphyromonadaceae bacterium OttesenSCG-928-L07]|nr:ribose 5-phosphate isomerase B [Porphyromonadaceae bacterium OttesenSCG-928-L07]MDL2252310.1 ribose 5-phosphate isomerase B [Odoribacter sp. OttesenSCG-928-J03]MDL2330570.1 ribose 5-phosphate isomerase B [Odoribacter sp. OttesenSCG-928-A06]